MKTYRVRGYNAGGSVILDAVAPDETGEGPEFYAFKVLHVDNVVCCAVWDNNLVLSVDLAGDVPLLVQCDPGLTPADIGLAF